MSSSSFQFGRRRQLGSAGITGAAAAGLLIAGIARATDGPSGYTPTWASVDQHPPAPEWYEYVTSGVYYLWGVLSVPGFADGSRDRALRSARMPPRFGGETSSYKEIKPWATSQAGSNLIEGDGPSPPTAGGSLRLLHGCRGGHCRPGHLAGVGSRQSIHEPRRPRGDRRMRQGSNADERYALDPARRQDPLLHSAGSRQLRHEPPLPIDLRLPLAGHSGLTALIRG